VKSSDTIKEISAALLKAQMAIKAAIKDSTNPHFRSKYADLSSVIEAVKEPLNKNSITFIQPVSFDEHGVLVETVLLHTSGEWISGTLAIPVSKQDAQGVGSAISYGRRYGLQAMCGVPAEDDDGNAATASTAASKITPVAGSLAALSSEDQAKAKQVANSVVDLWNEGKELAAYEAYYDAGYDNEFLLGVWEVLQPHSKIRNQLKAMHRDPEKRKAA
jgi:hypothetical protein